MSATHSPTPRRGDVPVPFHRRRDVASPSEGRNNLSRRTFFAQSALATGGLLLGNTLTAAEPTKIGYAQVAISLDLEMARNFPNWDDMHWDYEKGNLNDATKRYALEASKRVKARNGVIHFFLVGSALEQEDVSWLKQIADMGHSIGNHTYDHVYLLAKTPEEIQFKFKRAPWLIEGRKVSDVIRESVHLTNAALLSRLGIKAAGFRTPGGFATGLEGREDLQKMLIESGFRWVSSKYPAHPNSEQGKEPSSAILEGIVKAQATAQPFVYPSGLIEIPMAPISDVGAFRNGRWSLDSFLRATEMSLNWAIENRAVFDFLAHPAVLSAKDPEFKTIDLICHMVERAGDRAKIVNLDTIAATVQK